MAVTAMEAINVVIENVFYVAAAAKTQKCTGCYSYDVKKGCKGCKLAKGITMGV